MKVYIAPSTSVVRVHLESQLMQGSVRSFSTNLDDGDAIGYGGGSSTQSARVKSNAVDWNDDWSE